MNENQVPTELINYIVTARSSGVSDGDIVKALLDKGWEYESVSRGYKQAGFESEFSQVAESTPLYIEKKKKGLYTKIIITLVITAVVLVISAGVVWGVLGALKTSKDIITDAINNLKTLKFLSYNGTLSVKGSYSDGFDKYPVDVKISTQGDADIDNFPTGNNTTSLKSQLPGLPAEITITLETRYRDGTFYFKVPQSAGLLIGLPVPEDGIWLSFNSNDLESVYGEYNQEISSFEEESDENVLILQDLYEKYEPVSFSKGEKTDLNGKKMQLIDIELNELRLRGMFRELKDEYEMVSEEDFADFSKYLENVEFKNFKLFVGTRDNLLYRLTLTVDVTSYEDFPFEGNLDLDLNLSRFDEPIRVEVPENSINAREFIESAYSEYYGNYSEQF
ncbi:MAG: hypothetical protein COV70_02600 [Parcubacteria group bacterium CG11_big_fil_rev_8_21_14_0_20_39_22]|nr:MAG: hypothetical protein COV70_02600 [Parcubacteria group bacterium CG11_big_fil_rev_8_21_14_0_20_39_22]